MLKKLISLGGDRVPYVATSVQNTVEKILDVGCGYGWTLNALSGRAKELWGVDMDLEALSCARASYPQLNFIHQTGLELPFCDQDFDVVVLSEVIEHVGDTNKQGVIDEIYRVLKPGGLLILTAPYAGLFAWADPMDFKRRFPAVYKKYMQITHYNPSTAIEVGHKHVTLNEINALFAGRFEIESIRYCGLFMPILTWCLAIDSRLHLFPRSFHSTVNRFRGWESGIPYGRLFSYNIRLRANKNG